MSECNSETSRIGAPYIYDVRLLRVNGVLDEPVVSNLQGHISSSVRNHPSNCMASCNLHNYSF